MSNARNIADAGYKLIAFGKFNGASDYDPATLGLSDESTFGVSSIFDGGTGVYTVTFDQTLDHDDYCVVLGGTRGGATAEVSQQLDPSNYTTTNFKFGNTIASSGAVVDGTIMTFAVFYKD
jgi:hypothetical protein